MEHIGYTPQMPSRIEDAMTHGQILWECGGERILSVPSSPRHVVKTFEGAGAEEMRSSEISANIPIEICGYPAQKLTPIPVPSRYCCMLCNALPANGAFLKPSGANNNAHLDTIASQIAERYGTQAVANMYVFDLETKPKIIVVSCANWNPSA